MEEGKLMSVRVMGRNPLSTNIQSFTVGFALTAGHSEMKQLVTVLLKQKEETEITHK